MNVTREQLYKEVWTEPMLQVAARYQVSASFLARVCRRMNVPCPPRGYWQKRKAGTKTRIPPLPTPQPGDHVSWSKGSGGERLPPKPPSIKEPRPTKEPAAQVDASGRYRHLVGVEDHFKVAGETSYGYGGDVRELAFKNIGPCCRVASTRKQLMRLLILKPKGYISAGKRNYSHEAFLLTSDFTVGPEVMIQAYLRRWSIEVQHRDLKSLARLGKAQVRCREAVATAHAAMAAAFSLLWICALKKFGAARTDSHVPVALWQKKNWIQRGKKRVAEGKREPVVRATSADVLALLREGSFSGWSGGLARCA